jgi:hypothetical protein
MEIIMVKCKKTTVHPVSGETAFEAGKSYRIDSIHYDILGIIDEQDNKHFINRWVFADNFEGDYLTICRTLEEKTVDNIVEKANRRFCLHRVLDPLLMIKPDSIACVITSPDKRESLIFLSGMQVPIKIEGCDQDKPSYQLVNYVEKRIAPSLRVPMEDYKALLLFFKKISISALLERGKLDGEKWEKMGFGGSK